MIAKQIHADEKESKDVSGDVSYVVVSGSRWSRVFFGVFWVVWGAFPTCKVIMASQPTPPNVPPQK